MQRRTLIAVALVFATVAAIRSSTPARAAVSGLAADRIHELGLDADGLPIPAELGSTTDELVVQYDDVVDVTELAAQWTTGLDNAGYLKSEDHSESEARYVFEFQKDSQVYVVVVLTAAGGPIVAMGATSNASQHWAVNPASSPPTALAELW